MVRDIALCLSCVLGLFVLALPSPLAAQYLSVDSISLASNLGSSLSLADTVSDGSDAVTSSTPSVYRESIAKTSRARTSGDPARTAIENWIVVCVLGVMFTIGLVVTTVTIRSSNRESPHRIF